VDQHDPGRIARLSSPTPIEEMDPIAGIDDDHEAIGLGSVVRRRDGLHRT